MVCAAVGQGKGAELKLAALTGGVPVKRTRGKPRVMQSGGKLPHSKMGWVPMLGERAEDRIAGSGTSKAPFRAGHLPGGCWCWVALNAPWRRRTTGF